MVICLERGADCLHVVQLMALHNLLLHLNPDWFTYLVPAYLGYPGKETVKRV